MLQGLLYREQLCCELWAVRTYLLCDVSLTNVVLIKVHVEL
jgi:hypothetical protein